MIKGMIFDLDGALTSEREYVLGCLENTGRYIEKTYGTSGAFAELKKLLNEKWDKLFNRYFEKLKIPYDDGDIEKLVSVYRGTEPVTRLYPDTKEALEALKERDIQLVLLTNGYYGVQKKKDWGFGAGILFQYYYYPG